MRQQRNCRQRAHEKSQLNSENALNSATASFRFLRTHFQGIHPDINYFGGAGLLPCRCIVPLAYPPSPAWSVGGSRFGCGDHRTGCLFPRARLGMMLSCQPITRISALPKSREGSLLSEIRLDACERDREWTMIFARSGQTRCATQPDNTASTPYAIARPR